MTDAQSNTATSTWIFHVQGNANATFSGATPAPGGSTANARPTLSVTAMSAVALDKTKTTLTLDGVTLSPVQTQPVATQLNISGTDGTFGDGSHNAAVSVTDANGFVSTYTWSFTVAAPPSLTSPIPWPNQATGSARPPVGFWATDNSSGNLSVVLKIDGSQVYSGSIQQAVNAANKAPQPTAFWYVPTSDLAAGAHAVHADVTDGAGNTAVLDYGFSVANLGGMADALDCRNCHMGYSAPNHPSPQVASACTDCHANPSVWTPGNPDPWLHDNTQLGTAHQTSSASCSVAGCHNASLIDGHAQYPTSSAMKMQCATCHDSKDSRVRTAIANGDTSCTACHDAGPAGHGAVHDGGYPPAENVTVGCSCHNSNIMQGHDNNCDLCHKSTDPVVIAAIAEKNTDCGACHSTMHGATVTYFDFQEAGNVTKGAEFLRVFPATWTVDFQIDNGSWAAGTATPHSGYSQSTAKCGVCHAVHRAPTEGTSVNATHDNGGTGMTSSRYKASAWTSEASTQMLLKSTAARACLYCHVANSPTKMYAGDVTLGIVGDDAGGVGWGPFYAHTTACTSCHAVHGANTFKSPDGTVNALILKKSGVKGLGTVALKVQPEVYAGGSALYSGSANMSAGVLTPAATAAGVTPKQAAITAQCTICHASYAVDEGIINNDLLNAELFQPGTWKTANGGSTQIFVGNAANPVSVLPGVAGLTYTGGTPSAMTGAAGSLIMKYKNHPMKTGGQAFKGAGASSGFTTGNIVVSGTGSPVCQSCHNAPETATDGGYAYQSFPHYTPGYYKFMSAQDQTKFDTPASEAEFAMGRGAFYASRMTTDAVPVPRAGKPAVMNDGYCTKCHDKVGTDY
jgi:hypothetical protein